MSRIVIEMQGGLIQSVIADEPADVLVIDRDTDGMEPEELTIIEGEEAYLHFAEVEEDAEAVEAYISKIEAEETAAGGTDDAD